MSLTIVQAVWFETDVALRFEWYVREAGERVAWRFVESVDVTLRELARHPGGGSPRRFRDPALHGFRSLRVQPPFSAHLIFYRHTEQELLAERLLHGAQDLPRRLHEPPGSASG